MLVTVVHYKHQIIVWAELPDSRESTIASGTMKVGPVDGSEIHVAYFMLTFEGHSPEARGIHAGGG
jgi:hypothetical protein